MLASSRLDPGLDGAVMCARACDQSQSCLLTNASQAMTVDIKSSAPMTVSPVLLERRPAVVMTMPASQAITNKSPSEVMW